MLRPPANNRHDQQLRRAAHSGFLPPTPTQDRTQNCTSQYCIWAKSRPVHIACLHTINAARISARINSCARPPASTSDSSNEINYLTTPAHAHPSAHELTTQKSNASHKAERNQTIKARKKNISIGFGYSNIYSTTHMPFLEQQCKMILIYLSIKDESSVHSRPKNAKRPRCAAVLSLSQVRL